MLYRGPVADPWLWTPRPVARRRVRLFCFPYAGGSATAYRTWPDGLPPDVEMLAVQLPGRGPRLREPAIGRPGPLLDQIEGALSRYLDAPFAFFGHSMGAQIAFELTRRLRRQGRPLPAHLFLSGRRAPGRPIFPAPGPRSHDDLLALLRRYGGTPPGVLENEELLEIILPPFRADLELLDAWRDEPEPPLDVDMTLLGGRDDPTPTIADIDAWRDQTRAHCALHVLPGGHFFLHTEEAAVLRLVSGVLVEASLAAPPPGSRSAP